MQKREYKIKNEDTIANIINDIKIIEKHIDDISKRSLFYFKRSSKYKKRIIELENVKKYLLKRLEYTINEKNYH